MREQQNENQFFYDFFPWISDFFRTFGLWRLLGGKENVGEEQEAREKNCAIKFRF
jgi:hypothetical protein